MKQQKQKEFKIRQEQLVDRLPEAGRKHQPAEEQKLVRLIAARSRGPRKRDYKAPPANQPDEEEWRAGLAASGFEGGM